MTMARRHALLTGCVTALLLTACSQQTLQGQGATEQPSDPPAGAVTPSAEAIAEWNEACERAGLSGEGFAVVGEDPLAASLDRVQLCPFASEPVPDVERVSGVGAGGGLVAVVAARDRLDELLLFNDGRLRPVPGLGAVHAFTPSVSNDGLIAYVFVDSENGGSRLETHDPESQTTRVLHATDGDLLLTAWGPDDAVATVQAQKQDARDELLVVDAQRNVRRTVLPYEGGTTTAMAWTPGPLIALSSASTRTTPGVLLDALTGAARGEIPTEWKVRTWLASGDLLLKHRDTAMLGLLSPDEPGDVRTLAPFPAGPLWQLALSEES